jgi:hypothetical protein
MKRAITAPAGSKRTARLGRGNLKPPIELGYIFLAQKAVGFLHGAQTAQSEIICERHRTYETLRQRRALVKIGNNAC